MTEKHADPYDVWPFTNPLIVLFIFPDFDYMNSADIVRKKLFIKRLKGIYSNDVDLVDSFIMTSYYKCISH